MSLPRRALVLGASGAIGAAWVQHLQARGDFAEVIAASRRGAGHRHFDLTDEGSIAALAASIGGPLDLVVVATGVLHRAGGMSPEKALRQLDPAAMVEAYRINAVGPALIARHFAPLLARDRRAVFAALSARVGSLGDNRLGGWHSYRMAKAALNMLLRNLAIELARTHPLAVVAGLHPGTVDSALSAPFQRGLPEGQLTATETAAANLMQVLDALTPADSGKVFDWRGERVPD